MTSETAQRRPDPGRRERILAAALDVIATEGVAGVSHRKVAAAAGVPLGSMTYHFEGIDALVVEALAGFAATVSSGFEQRLSAAADRVEARDAVLALIVADVLQHQRELVLTQELYTLAARDPAARRLTLDWMAASRAALGRHFDEPTARMLDALIEGITLHRALGDGGFDDELVRTAVDAILASG